MSNILQFAIGVTLGVWSVGGFGALALAFLLRKQR